MKKILFVNSSFAVGGIQSSLQNMLEYISKYYEIDLFVLFPEGLFRDKVPENVNVITPDWRLNSFGMSQKQCIKYGSFRQIIFRTFAGLWAKIISNRLPIYIAEKHQKKLEKEYDVAIAYRHERKKSELCSGYISIIDNCVNAKKKISWIHNDAACNPLDEEYNNDEYEKVDKIVCVSQSIKSSFVSFHPAFASKTDVCYNFLSEHKLNMLSGENPFDPAFIKKFVCFSACRLSPEKNIVAAIDAFADSFQKHSNVVWVIAGDGVERERIKCTIDRYHLEERIILIGQITNTYPYIKHADLVISTSLYEAAPMLYSEARILKTPVFTTETASSKEMLHDGKFGIICENSSEGLSKGFEALLNDSSLLKRINAELQLDKYSNDDMKAQFESIICF